MSSTRRKKPKKSRRISRLKIRSTVRTVRKEQQTKEIPIAYVDSLAPKHTATGSAVIVFHVASGEYGLTGSAAKVKKTKKKSTAKKARKKKAGKARAAKDS